MLPAIKSEFRKLFTVRSTYGLVIVSMLIVALFAGYGDGFRGSAASLSGRGLLANESVNAVVFGGLLLAFVGLLLAGNEYRYNAIFYTLTSVNRRYKVLLAKLVAITSFALVTSLLLIVWSPLCTIVGAHLGGHTIGRQDSDIGRLLWSCLFCGWGYAMYAFILLIAIRNQIGAIVTFLLVPLIGENILGLVLKGNIKYLPFTALQGVPAPHDLGNHTSSGHQAVVVLIYVALGLLVSFVLFQRRDAN